MHLHTSIIYIIHNIHALFKVLYNLTVCNIFEMQFVWNIYNEDILFGIQPRNILFD